MCKEDLFSFLEKESKSQNFSKMRTIDIFNLISKEFGLYNLSFDERDFYIQIIKSYQRNHDFINNIVHL